MLKEKLIEKLKTDKDNVEALMTTAGVMPVHKIDEVTDDIVSMWSIGFNKSNEKIISKTVIQTEIILGYGVQAQLELDKNISNLKTY